MEIRHYLPEDKPKLLDLIRAVYNENIYEKALKRFRWQYEENPYNTPEGASIIIVETDNKIVGMCGYFALKLKTGDAIEYGYWGGDFMVHPDYRTHHCGFNLVKKILQEPILYMGFPAKKIVELWSWFGALPFGELAEYSKTVYPSFFRNKRKKIFLYIDQLMEPLFQRLPQGIRIIDIDHFDKRFDELWERASKNYRNLQVRDSQYLNWRFFKCPHLTYRVLAAVKENNILGYVVIRHEQKSTEHEGNMVDLFADRSDSFISEILIRAGIRALKDAGCDTIKIRVSFYDDFLKKIIIRNSFFITDRKFGLFSNNVNNDLNSKLKDMNSWYLTKADSDLDFA